MSPLCFMVFVEFVITNQTAFFSPLTKNSHYPKEGKIKTRTAKEAKREAETSLQKLIKKL
ncbi:MAG: hypothetical protein QW445_01635 [Candidatus Bathyarchaeia archaeon]